MIQIKANAPALRPKTNPEDMQKIKDLYSFLHEHLEGLEAEMERVSCESLTITVGKKPPEAEEKEKENEA